MGLCGLPLVMLSLPSFTYVGMALTAVAVVAYLRWKRLAAAEGAGCVGSLCGGGGGDAEPG